MSLVDICCTRIVSASDIKCWKYGKNLIYAYFLHYTDFIENHNAQRHYMDFFLCLFSLKLVKITESTGIS